MHQLITRNKTEFQRIDIPFKTPIKSIKCCGNSIILFVLTMDNSLYIYGEDSETQDLCLEKYCEKTKEFNKIHPKEFNNEKIKFIECSCEGLIVVTENNEIYVVGLNHSNQFALKDKTVDVRQFTKLTKFISNMEDIKFIRCSYDCMFVVTDNNVIYGCGENDKGQFGLGHNNKLLAFTKNDSLQQNGIKDLRCGDYHCMVLDKFGNVYGCGSNSSFQIIPYNSFNENDNENSNSDEIKKEILYFTKVNLPFKVQSIRCNIASTIFLSTVGDIYFIGKRNGHTKICLKLNNLNTLIKNIISDSYGDKYIYITKNNKLYVDEYFSNNSSDVIEENRKLDLTEIMSETKNSMNLYVLDNFGHSMYILLADYFIDVEGNKSNNGSKLFFDKLKNQLVNIDNTFKDIAIISTL
ncbi:hypothetical protein ABK040_008931 [Willaertia magna]